MAACSLDQLADGDCFRLGEWYYRTLLDAATGDAKSIVLSRAKRYYERYLAAEGLKGIPRIRAGIALKAINTSLARMRPTPRKPIFPKGAVAYGGHHYMAVMKRVGWAEAVMECRKLGGHLATVESGGEGAFLRRIVGSGRLWVGATDSRREGTWLWINGRSVPKGSAIWDSGEPDGGKSSNCASMTSGGMRDTPGAYSAVTGFICEWDR